MGKVIDFFLEFLLAFTFVYLIYYFVVIRKNNEYKIDHVPVEVNFILTRYKIDIKRINYRHLLYLISILTSFNIALVITIIFSFTNNVYFGIFFSLIVVIPLSIIGYSYIGKYFSKKTLQK